MPTLLQGTCDDATISLTTEFGHWELPNDREKQNKKSLSIFLRACCHPETGKPLFTSQQIADALGYKDRQDTNNFWRQFEASGKQFRDFLHRTMNVDDTVVEAVKAEVCKDILASAPSLCDRVSQRLGRSNLTEANIRAALENIPCTVIRQQLRTEWEAGAWHPKEQKLLEAIMQEWAESEGSRSDSVFPQIDGLGTSAQAPRCEEIVQGQQAKAVTSLFTPHAAMQTISAKIRLMVVALTLYYWNVPLSRIALWMGVSKTTTYHRVIGVAVAAFPVVQTWISEGVKGAHLVIDEKWLKIRGCWWYWCVALDDETGLPLLNRLLPSQGSWACCWFLGLLKHLGKTPRTIITDGLAAYESAIATVFQTTTHILCVFHHQQGVTAWLTRHLPDAPMETVKLLKRKMKHIVQTCDPRTALRRLHALDAQNAEEGWGLSAWIATTRSKLDRLRPALRRNQSPRTTNQVERFFRAFQRFYKTRGGFHSIISARRELMLFVVVSVFTQQAGSGQAPIEQIVPQAKDMPFYQIINAPFRHALTNICLPNIVGDTNMATG